MMSEDQDTRQNDKDRQGRLERLGPGNTPKGSYDPTYSKFIRRAQMILPLVAVAIIAVVFTWSTAQKPIQTAQEAATLPSVGKNELLNPRFESKDEKKQPYTITAKRAIQGETNDNLVILERPIADMLLNSGQWVAVKAKQGAFRQDTKRLLLKGDVQIYHDLGYEMKMPLLNINMENNTAWTDADVYGQGPEGTIEAKGLQADSLKGTLVFTGPAKLTLISTADMGDMVGE